MGLPFLFSFAMVDFADVSFILFIGAFISGILFHMYIHPKYFPTFFSGITVCTKCTLPVTFDFNSLFPLAFGSAFVMVIPAKIAST